MRPGVLIRATIRAKTFAFGATQAEGRSGKQPLFTNSRSKIELLILGVQEVDVWIIGLLIPALGENEVRLVAHVCGRLLEAATAFEGDVSFDSSVPIEPARARRRQASGDVHRVDRQRIAFYPDRVSGGQLFVNDSGVGLERPNVKGQHPPKLADPQTLYKSLE